ncbi:carboxymuconolactone decarboxylase family protein [Pigmentiphaga litoralis]|uniref:carboxymuconolactone decarboxylase family protein n=1 Tax=Pigmentiphaga litoralis TaxID=516702 RepID=UPI003B431425
MQTLRSTAVVQFLGKDQEESERLQVEHDVSFQLFSLNITECLKSNWTDISRLRRIPDRHNNDKPGETMPRVPDLDPAVMTDHQRKVYDMIASGPRGRVRGPLAVWLNRPGLAEHAQALGQYCRYDSSLPPRLSELAILVLARHWNSEFEWWAHKAIALKAGLPADVIDAIRDRQPPRLHPTAKQSSWTSSRCCTLSAAYPTTCMRAQ